jgi:hypothetical protein
MPLEFSASEGDALGGLLFYLESEYSFRFEAGSPVDLSDRVGNGGVTSLLIGTLQIEVSVDSTAILYIWGLHPKSRWETGPVTAPSQEAGVVRLSGDVSLNRGVSLKIAEVGRWKTTFDSTSGWVRVSEDNLDDERQILVASDTVLGIRDNSLNTIWLRPLLI